MAKIPLEKTIGGAYRFLFSNLPSIIGIVWFPYLLFGGLAGAVIWYAITHYSLTGLSFDPNHPNFAPLYAFVRLYPLVVFLFVLAELIATIGLVRKALGLMEGTTFFFFTLGAPLWRFLAAMLLIYVIVIAVPCVFALAGILWVRFGQGLIPAAPVRALVDTVGVIVMVCLFVYIVLRLVFFVPAVVVAESRIGIARSWALGAGNFWRIVVTLLMIVLPTAIALGMLNSIISSVLYGPMPMPPFVGHPHPDPQAVLAFYKLLFARIGPAVIAIQLLTLIAVRALYAGAVANAYRSVTSTDAAPAA